MIGILGGGESGVGAALLAQRQGEIPFVSDHGIMAPKYREELVDHQVRFEEGGHSFDSLVQTDYIIKSPGIPDHVEILKRLRLAGKEVISEIEYAFRCCPGRIIGITGSNGKTTTTNLLAHLLSYAGCKVQKGGNVGTSFSRLLVSGMEVDYYVIEVSSFQLDNTTSFRPDYAFILNLSPDHLDRYGGSFDAYADSKLRITAFQHENDMLFHAGWDKEVSRRLAKFQPKARVVTISSTEPFLKLGIQNPYLRGRHNAMNASFAMALMEELGIAKDLVRAGLEDFRNDDHRMQSVARIDNVEWINDSKATNVDSAYYALESLDSPVIWLAGGLDKGNEYERLVNLVRKKVRAVICLGVDNEKLLSVFSPVVDVIREADRMSEAVHLADSLTEQGDRVLLSPSCASFDRYENYEDRGRQFIQAVWDLFREKINRRNGTLRRP